MYVSVSVPRRMANDGPHLIKFRIIYLYPGTVLAFLPSLQCVLLCILFFIAYDLLFQKHKQEMGHDMLWRQTHSEQPQRSH